MAGKIHEKGQFWVNTLKASKFVSSIIEHGYSLPFMEACTPFYAKNNASSLQHRNFVEDAIENLLQTGCIVETEKMPFVCNPLTVAEGKKLRLVLDLRHVNQFLEKPTFKYEDLRTFAKMFEQGYYIACFDLKNGYHHVAINPEHYKYLGFAWIYESGNVRYFFFVVLPFGLSPACYAFTKLLRPLIKKWRGEGIRSVIFIDDGIFGSESKRITAYACLKIREDLENAGFTINEEKSTLYPHQVGKWLGFHIDMKNFTLSVPLSKIEKLQESLKSNLNEPITTARKIAKLAGSIIAMGPAIGPLTRLFTRNMYRFIYDCPTWDKPRSMQRAVTEEMLFWKENLNHVNGYAIKAKHACTKIIYTDASDHAYGGFILEKLGNKIAHGEFVDAEEGESSTYRELAAVKYVLQGFKYVLAHQRILWHSDNINATKIINVGSSKNHLQSLALEIHKLCLQSDIQIVSKWIPREQNTLADEISKYYDTDDWGVDNETFAFIQEKFGKFDIDRFASSSNNRTSRYDARFHCPNAETINTFTANWRHDFNWLCPPITLIAETLKHAKLCNARGVLFVPEWPSAYFWPLLTPDGRQFYSFVTKFLSLDPYFLNNSKSTSVFTGFAKFRSLALLVEF